MKGKNYLETGINNLQRKGFCLGSLGESTVI